jgi:hypothetical protein
MSSTEILPLDVNELFELIARHQPVEMDDEQAWAVIDECSRRAIAYHSDPFLLSDPERLERRRVLEMAAYRRANYTDEVAAMLFNRCPEAWPWGPPWNAQTQAEVAARVEPG